MNSEPITDSEVRTLPVKPKPRPRHEPPHAFGSDVYVECDGTADRKGQSERTCPTCGLVKITVHGTGGDVWREWRLKGDRKVEVQFTGEAPACVEAKP